MTFPDGGVPDDNIVTQWLKLCKLVFEDSSTEGSAIGIHCIAGLGRHVKEIYCRSLIIP
jgi:hypothetical protein